MAMQYPIMKGLPNVTSWSPEQMESFRSIVKQLFSEYPVENPSLVVDAAQWRRDAVKVETPQSMLYLALDTGVPNDLLLAHYALIFQ